MSSESASFQSKLLRVKNRFQEVEDLLSGGAIVPAEMAKLSKELSDLRPVVEAIQLLDQMQGHLKETEELLAEGDLDKEMKDLAREENIELKERVENQIVAIKVLLLPKDEMDDRNAIMEIRAGTGGDEAGLFAADLLRMYQRYAEIKGWKVELMDISDTGVGGIREASLNISGKSVFAHLKFESGVHRVQRVPETEASGRIHTSAATVAVLPEAEEVDVILEDKDLKIDVYRSSGPGGQSVNTTDSAVRITHLPTGIVVQQQDEKSQHKNKAKALKILRARILDKKCQELADARSASRKNQIGSGDRSERIRTYNFPQGRVTDHRINLTLYKLDKIINGEALDELVEALVTHDQAARLADEG